MTEGASEAVAESDAASGVIRQQLILLSSGLGVRRRNLARLFAKKLPDLAQLWEIDGQDSDESAQKKAVDRLIKYLPYVQPIVFSDGEWPLARKQEFQVSYQVGFNMHPSPATSDLILGQRQSYLDELARFRAGEPVSPGFKADPKLKGVGARTARRNLESAISAIEQIILASGYVPISSAGSRSRRSASGSVVKETLSARTTGKPISEWDSRSLHVHKAIHTTPRADAALPSYFARSHDTEIADILTDVSGSAMVILVGESSTGKTRALFNAISNHSILSSWPLEFPRTARQLNELVDDIAPRTLLWLDEAQNCLTGSGGEAAAVALQELLCDATRSPVIVLGTLWPAHWFSLHDGKYHSESYPMARDLLRHHARRVHVAAEMTERGVVELLADSNADADLKIAALNAGANRQVIQTLAGGPMLLEQYFNPSTPRGHYAQAVITASLDVYRLGHDQLIHRALIYDAAPHYLRGRFRVNPPEDWIQQGIEHGTEERYGVSALVQQRLTAGVGEADCLQVHDYLQQHTQDRPIESAVPAELWDDLQRHVVDSFILSRLAGQALARGFYDVAVGFYRSAGSELPASSQGWFVQLLMIQGQVDEALEVWRSFRPSVFNSLGLAQLITTLPAMGRFDEAIAVCHTAIEKGDEISSRFATDSLPGLVALRDNLSYEEPLSVPTLGWPGDEMDTTAEDMHRSQLRVAKKGAMDGHVFEQYRAEIIKGRPSSRRRLVELLLAHDRLAEAIREFHFAVASYEQHMDFRDFVKLVAKSGKETLAIHLLFRGLNADGSLPSLNEHDLASLHVHLKSLKLV